MKNTLLALSLGMTAAITGTSAFANTGTINFEGRITASTCPVEVVNPGDGTIGNVVKMGSVEASRFTAVGEEHMGKAFVLRMTDVGGNCGTGDATVTFNGFADPSGQYFAVGQSSADAKGVAIAIRDKTNTNVAPGAESAPYAVIEDGETNMLFTAYYRSINATVTAGPASADVQFVVAVN